MKYGDVGVIRDSVGDLTVMVLRPATNKDIGIPSYLDVEPYAMAVILDGRTFWQDGWMSVGDIGPIREGVSITWLD